MLSRLLARTRWLVTCLALLLGLLVAGWVWLRWPGLQWGPFLFDRLGSFFILLILGAGLLSCLQMYRAWLGAEQPVYSWLLLATLGSVVMVTSTNLLLLFVGYELATITMLAWIGGRQPSRRSDEVKLKYFVTAGVSTAFLLLGLVLFYSMTASLNLFEIQERLLFVTDTITVRLALLCFVVGAAYKLAWVPFQFVVPDLYEGAVTPALGFMAVVSKLSGLAILLRVIHVWWHIETLPWSALFTTMAVFCLLFGSITALVQTNLKRRLAYTAIGQVGFLLAGLAVANASPAIQEQALSAVLFYSLAYSLMILGSFALVWALRTADDVPVEASDYAGLADRAPWGAACLALFLCGLSGLPPTIGFIGKFDLVNVVVAGDKIGLAFVMVLAWILSAAAYLPIVLAMFFKSTQHEKVARISYPLLLVVSSCALLTLYWGLLPATLLQVATESARALIY